MSIAVIGAGNTGQAVVKLLGQRCIEVFTSRHRPSVEALKHHQGAIVFVPTNAAAQTMALLQQAAIPVAWGTTGMRFDDDFAQTLRAPWVVAGNFSLSMIAIKQALHALGRWAQISQAAAHCHEVHHRHKQDQPSGTAKAWQQWLDYPSEISSERKGDICGIHELTLTTRFESITLKHQAHSRQLFAQGAIWALDQLLTHVFAPGLYDLSALIKEPGTVNEAND